jgi:hypothetical protein
MMKNNKKNLLKLKTQKLLLNKNEKRDKEKSHKIIKIAFYYKFSSFLIALKKQSETSAKIYFRPALNLMQ